MPDPDYLFVYGSLRKDRNGALHRFLNGHADFIDYAVLPGRLYRVANYPGLIADADSGQTVKGEVYLPHAAAGLFQTLDDHEECSEQFPRPHEYRRRQMTVYLSGNRPLLAWVYLYNRPVSDLQEIIGGDYRHIYES